MKTQLFLAFALATSFAAIALADEMQLMSKTCQEDSPRQNLTSSCLALIQSGKLSRYKIPWAYWQLAQNFADRQLSRKSSDNDNDLLQSISYLRKAISAELENFAANPAYRDERHPQLGSVNLGKVSAWYEQLGLLLALARSGQGETDEGYSFAKQERDSYSSAILYDRRNYKAHLGLAKVLSLLCRSSEADTHLKTAVRLVRQIEPNLAYQYEREVLRSCYSSWKDRT